MLFAMGGPAAAPVFVAAICSYTTVCGLGIPQVNERGEEGGARGGERARGREGAGGVGGRESEIERGGVWAH
jgi:hypothetical protein